MRRLPSVVPLFALIILCGCATTCPLAGGPGLEALRPHLEEGSEVTARRTYEYPGGWLEVIDVSTTTGQVDAVPVINRQRFAIWPVEASHQAREAISECPELRGLRGSRFIEENGLAILVINCGEGEEERGGGEPQGAAGPLSEAGE